MVLTTTAFAFLHWMSNDCRIALNFLYLNIFASFPIDESYKKFVADSHVLLRMIHLFMTSNNNTVYHPPSSQFFGTYILNIFVIKINSS
jgi:hypothetical protein